MIDVASYVFNFLCAENILNSDTKAELLQILKYSPQKSCENIHLHISLNNGSVQIIQF